MPAHQCPRCPLMFSFRTEVEYHLASDHRPPSPRTITSDDDADANERCDEQPAQAERVGA